MNNWQSDRSQLLAESVTGRAVKMQNRIRLRMRDRFHGNCLHGERDDRIWRAAAAARILENYSNFAVKQKQQLINKPTTVVRTTHGPAQTPRDAQPSASSCLSTTYSISFCRILPGRDHNLWSSIWIDGGGATVQPFQAPHLPTTRQQGAPEYNMPLGRRRRHPEGRAEEQQGSLEEDYSTIDWLFDEFIRGCQWKSLLGRRCTTYRAGNGMG